MATFDVTEADFAERVLQRSHEVPVVVDFWAEWCGPCRALTPLLEKAATARDGEVDLAKLDTDANQTLAASFGIRGIPAVKAFKDGRVVNEFTGAIPGPQVEQFFDSLVPTEAEKLAQSDDEDSLRRALELDARNASAAAGLGRLLLRRGDVDEAVELLEPFEHDFEGAGLAARAKLQQHGTDLDEAFRAWDEGDHATTLDALQEALAEADDYDMRDLIRRIMVAIFTELGPQDELAREHRRRLAAAIS
jgi:putative thioredoxin